MRFATVICLSTWMILGGAGVAAAETWYVACDTSSQRVVLTQSVGPAARTAMSGPLPSRRIAEMWLAENCPGAACDADARCVEGAAAARGGAGGEWVAGEVSSVALDGEEDVPADAAGPAGPGGPTGPTGGGLQPLMDNAEAAVQACNFHAALLTADQMTNFDPEHPWLVANHDRLRDLARRQLATEEAVWQASSAMSEGRLKKARKLARAAAKNCVSCQSSAVAELIDGIDAAIAHKKQVTAAKNRAAMAALLPGLVDLANTAIAMESGNPPPPPSAPPSSGSTGTISLGSGITIEIPDPCAFKYEYRNVWNTEPVCTCDGYRFDARQHRCVK